MNFPCGRLIRGERDRETKQMKTGVGYVIRHWADGGIGFHLQLMGAADSDIHCFAIELENRAVGGQFEIRAGDKCEANGYGGLVGGDLVTKDDRAGGTEEDTALSGGELVFVDRGKFHDGSIDGGAEDGGFSVDVVQLAVDGQNIFAHRSHAEDFPSAAGWGGVPEIHIGAFQRWIVLPTDAFDEAFTQRVDDERAGIHVGVRSGGGAGFDGDINGIVVPTGAMRCDGGGAVSGVVNWGNRLLRR